MFLLSDDCWEIKKTSKKGRGIFAKKDILPGAIIGDYLGRVIQVAEEHIYEKMKMMYLMYYHNRATIYPDPKKPGIHLINHSCTPNCWMHTYKGHVLYFSLRRIFAGEELTVDYLIDPLDKTCKPCTHICTCDGVICHQTMHLSKKKYDVWRKFSDEEAKRTKRQSVTYGKELPLLSSYPKNIPDNAIYNLFGSLMKPSYVSEGTMLPSTTELRNKIRQTGNTLQFSKINTLVYGIMDDLVISKTITSETKT